MGSSICQTRALFFSGFLSEANPAAPPDNVLVLPIELWHYLFSEQITLQPGSVHFQVHARTTRSDLPATPEAAYAWQLQRTHHLELSTAGHGILADNLAARLAERSRRCVVRKDSLSFFGFTGISRGDVIDARDSWIWRSPSPATASFVTNPRRFGRDGFEFGVGRSCIGGFRRWGYWSSACFHS